MISRPGVSLESLLHEILRSSHLFSKQLALEEKSGNMSGSYRHSSTRSATSLDCVSQTGFAIFARMCITGLFVIGPL